MKIKRVLVVALILACASLTMAPPSIAHCFVCKNGLCSFVTKPSLDPGWSECSVQVFCHPIPNGDLICLVHCNLNNPCYLV